MQHSEEVLGIPFVPNNQRPKVLEPGGQAFDLPAATMLPHTEPILGIVQWTSLKSRDVAGMDSLQQCALASVWLTVLTHNFAGHLP